MTPYILMLASTCIGIAGSSFMKQYEKKNNSGRFLYLTVLCFFATLFFVVTNKNGYSFNPKVIFYGLLSAFFYCTAYYLTFVAYASGSFVLTNLIISFSLISSIIYGLCFLEDKLSVFGYIGLALILISIVFINIPKNKARTHKKFSWKWLLSALGCFAGNSAIAIIKKMQQVEFGKINENHDNEYAVYMIGGAFAVFLITSLLVEKNEWKHFFSTKRLYAIGTGVCNGAQNFISLLLNSMMILSKIGPISTGITIALNFVASLVFFKERFSKLQITGVALGTAAVILLSI